MFKEIEIIVPDHDADPIIVLPQKTNSHRISIFLEDNKIRFFDSQEEIGCLGNLEWAMADLFAEFSALGCVVMEEEELK